MLSGIPSSGYTREQACIVWQFSSSLIREDQLLLTQYAAFLRKTLASASLQATPDSPQDKVISYITAITQKKAIIPRDYAVEELHAAMALVLDHCSELISPSAFSSLMVARDLNDPLLLEKFLVELAFSKSRDAQMLAELFYLPIHLFKLAYDTLSFEEMLAGLSLDKKEGTCLSQLADGLLGIFTQFLKRQLPTEVAAQFHKIFERALTNSNFAFPFSIWKEQKIPVQHKAPLSKPLFASYALYLKNKLEKQMYIPTKRVTDNISSASNSTKQAKP